jgi:hypothetical protein
MPIWVNLIVKRRGQVAEIRFVVAKTWTIQIAYKRCDIGSLLYGSKVIGWW